MLREFNVKPHYQVSSLVAQLQRAKWVVVQDWHALAFYQLSSVRTYDFIHCDLYLLVVKSGEVHWRGHQAVQQGDLVVVDEVVASPLELRVRQLLDGDDQVAALVRKSLVPLSWEPDLRCLARAWLDSDVFVNNNDLLTPFVAHEGDLLEQDFLLAAVEQLLQSALHLYSQLQEAFAEQSAVSLLELLQQSQTLPLIIQCNGEGVVSAEELLEYLGGVATEAVAVSKALLWVWHSVLKQLLPITIVHFPQPS